MLFRSDGILYPQNAVFQARCPVSAETATAQFERAGVLVLSDVALSIAERLFRAIAAILLREANF